jgi:hypothetical protein
VEQAVTADCATIDSNSEVAKWSANCLKMADAIDESPEVSAPAVVRAAFAAEAETCAVTAATNEAGRETAATDAEERSEHRATLVRC